MRIVLSGGGTAGHINPALALADVLRERGHEVLFAGTPGGIESRLVPAAGIPYKAFEAAGFNRNHPLTLPKAIMKIQRSTKLARKWFSEVHPDCVVGFGGYVCIPVARAAEQCGIPVVVHEQNSVMGMANKYLARRARAVCLTYDHAARALSDKSHVVLTGNPVRASVFAATRAEGRAAFGVPEDARMLLVTGGSLGARHLNAAIVQRKDMLLGYPDLHIVHVTGPKELDSVTEQLALTDEQAKRWRLMGYTDQDGPCHGRRRCHRQPRGRHVACRDFGPSYPGAARAVPVRHRRPSDHERPRMRGSGRGLPRGRRRRRGRAVHRLPQNACRG